MSNVGMRGEPAQRPRESLRSPETPMELRHQYCSAMRRFAASVSAFAMVHDGVRHVITVTAVTSVSADPPTLLVCIHRKSRIHPVLAIGRGFSLNILSARQREISVRYGGGPPGSQAYDEVWDTDTDGVCCLAGAQANIICDIKEILEGESHAIVLGTVRWCRHDPRVASLIYVDGAYATVRPLSIARQ